MTYTPATKWISQNLTANRIQNVQEKSLHLSLNEQMKQRIRTNSKIAIPNLLSYCFHVSRNKSQFQKACPFLLQSMSFAKI